MKDFFEGIGLGIMLGVSILLFILSSFDMQPEQTSYEQMHRGEVACVDTPDNKVYCYPTKSTKGEKRD